MGEVFKIHGYNRVSSIVERVKQGTGRKKSLQKRVEELRNNISKSQRQT